MMARSNIAHALETVDVLRERWLDRASDLFAKLGLWDAELDDWRDAVERIVTGFDPVTGLFEEFAGFHALELIDLREYASRDEPIDLIIGAERTKRTRVVRQADIVALITLLPDKFPEAIAEKNFRYYEPICAHGSSLSAGAHALVAARTGQADLALHYLRETASRDLDLDPNSAGGVRIADFDSLWGAVVFGFAGLNMGGRTLAIDPKLPPNWKNPSFRVRWKGRSIAIRIANGSVETALFEGPPMDIRVAGMTKTLTTNGSTQAT